MASHSAEVYVKTLAELRHALMKEHLSYSHVDFSICDQHST